MNLITTHLDTWTSAIKKKSSAGRGGGKKQEFYGIKKLRELILELAVRGLLVPQDPEDITAPDNPIRNKKSRADAPFKIPQTWTWTELGQLTDVNGGFAFKSTAYNDEGMRVIRISDFDEFGFKDHKVVRHPFSSELQKFTLAENDILMAMTGGTVGKSYLVRALVEPMIVNQRVATIKVSKNNDPRYIDITIKSKMTQEVIRKAKNSTNDNISMADIKGFSVPLPPLAEQDRIVAKVGELMALCDQLEQQQEDSARTHGTLVQTLLGALTAASERGQFEQAWHRIASHFDTLFTTESSIDQLKQTILQLAVMGKLILELAVRGLLVPQDPEDITAPDNPIRNKKSRADAPFKIPQTWTWTELGQLTDVNGGFAFKSTAYNDEGMRVIRISDFDEFGFKDHKVVRHPFSSELQKFTLAENDILMAMTGGTVGKSYLVRALVEPMIVNQRVATIKVSKNNDPRYIDITIKSKMTQEVIRKAKNSTNDNISMADIKGFSVPLPPLAEQDRIVAKVGELMTLCDRLKASLQTAQATQLHLADSLVEAAIH